MLRTGLGYDVHPLVSGRKLFLGGVEIPHDTGLEGHSDADVLLHAIADAVLGAMAAGDIGVHFPNSDPRWKGVSSLVFLEEIREMLRAKGARLHNVDATVIAEAPKINPHTATMREAIARSLGVESGQISLKATTNERLGFAGRKEGIAAMAIALVDMP
ncbi:MAG: 2-C-methyl-D-erythritol 2,4-cyclodiphosphate synthase [Candidatus Methylacidiphilales bacterium]